MPTWLMRSKEPPEVQGRDWNELEKDKETSSVISSMARLQGVVRVVDRTRQAAWACDEISIYGQKRLIGTDFLKASVCQSRVHPLSSSSYVLPSHRILQVLANTLDQTFRLQNMSISGSNRICQSFRS